MSLQVLRQQLKPGGIYRRDDLKKLSPSVDRALYTLVRSGELTKESQGIYYRPVQGQFGLIGPDVYELVCLFLKSDDFIMFTYSDLTVLGLGLTQQYNRYIVYNNKRHEVKKMAGFTFDFRRRPNFPTKVTPEFLLVEYFNQEDKLPEKTPLSDTELAANLGRFDQEQLLKIARDFGKVKTRKKVAQLQESHELHS